MNTKLLANIFRWIARIIGIVLAGMALCIVIFTRVPNPFALPFDNQVAFFALTLVLLGFLLAWRWESVGGIISLFGWILNVTVESVFFPDTVYFVVLGVPCFLFLASSFLRHHETRKSA